MYTFNKLMNPALWGGVVISEDRVWSQTVEIWDYHWLKKFISISLCIQVVCNDDKPNHSSEGDLAHTITLPPP